GILAARHGSRVLTLEQDVGWYRAMSRDLRRLRLQSVDLHYAPLRDFGSFEWYDIDGVDIPSKLADVICDGPFAARGYRAGLLPVLIDRGIRFRDALCDDGDAREAPEMLEYWAEHCGAQYELRQGTDGILAVVTPGGQAIQRSGVA
ncbi:MAG TPA: hypothetical protein VK636_03850, partial [Gemmatimonadaceae bacterium]|nr:hypothetical protein [Gemmatimonadaceae bacterium]